MPILTIRASCKSRKVVKKNFGTGQLTRGDAQISVKYIAED